MSIHPAFLGHGIFTEFPDALLNAIPDGSPMDRDRRTVNPREAKTRPVPMSLYKRSFYEHSQRMGLRVGRSGMIAPNVTGRLIAALRKAKLDIAAWGYCSAMNTARRSGPFPL
jgi:hypothetical protein